MNEPLGKQTREHPPASRPHFLKGMWAWPGGKSGPAAPPLSSTQLIYPAVPEAHSLSVRSREAVAAQLATSLRLQGLDDESQVMLGLLVTLVQAGEITFRDFAGRAENLFPQHFARMDAALRQKIIALSQ